MLEGHWRTLARCPLPLQESLLGWKVSNWEIPSAAVAISVVVTLIAVPVSCHTALICRDKADRKQRGK